jgi:hypothetical protein
LGQTIEINKTAAVDRVLVIDTDRSIAGQDGVAFNGLEAARRSSTFPGRLAALIFESDGAVDRVFVMSNTISVRRIGEWQSEATEQMTSLVSGFFRFYD